MDKLLTIIESAMADLGPAPEPVREAVRRRIQAAYWIGALDGHTITPSAERRSEPRSPGVDHSRSNRIIDAMMRP